MRSLLQPTRARWIVLLALLAALVIAGHVALWTSDEPTAFKWRLTLLNAAGWTVALAPILLVNLWLRATLDRNAKRPPPGGDGRR